jgi:hypothetical protein
MDVHIIQDHTVAGGEPIMRIDNGQRRLADFWEKWTFISSKITQLQEENPS